MIGFWYFVPKSGVAFIFLSVLTIVIWNGNRNTLEHPLIWIFAVEIGLFIICFIAANRESRKKIDKTL